MIYYDRFNSYYTESYIDQDMTTGASDYNDDSFDDEDDIYND